MKKHALVLSSFFVLAAALPAHANLRVCNDMFSNGKARLAKMTADESLKAREAQLAAKLSEPGSGVALSGLLNRYEDLLSYAHSDPESTEGRMMTAAPVAILSLSAASVKRGLSVQQTIEVIEKVGTKVSARGFPLSDRRYELWLPSRILLKLSELAIEKQITPEQVAGRYNLFVREINEGALSAENVRLPKSANRMQRRAIFNHPLDLANPMLKPPMDFALDQLIESLY